MSCQKHRETDLIGESPLESLAEVDRNYASIEAASLDFDSICLNYQLPRYLVPTSCEEVAGEVLPLSMELERTSLFAGHQAIE